MGRSIRRFIRRLEEDQSGATAVEYGIILALMFLVILSALTAFGDTGSGVFNSAMTTLKSAMG